MNRNAGKWAAIAALTMSGAASHAQRSDSMGLTVRLGYFYPASTAARRAGASWFSFGADIKLHDMGETNGVRAWLQVSGDVLQNGDYRSIPLTINYISDTGQFYYLAGAGVSFAELRNRDNELQDSVKFAYQIGFGYHIRGFGMPAFAEIKWMGTEESRLNGWGVFLGVRF